MESEAQQVRVFMVNPLWPANYIESAYEFLGAAEKKRVDRLRVPEARHGKIVSQFVRWPLLSDFVGVSLQELKIGRKERGKPFIQAPITKCRFNVSDTRDMIAIALSCGFEVGVDIENKSRKIKDIEQFARFLLSKPEQRRFALLHDGERREFLLRTWVLKEAMTKALGLGLHQSFSVITVDCFAEFGGALIEKGSMGHCEDVFLGVREVSGYYIGVCLLGVNSTSVSCNISLLTAEDFVHFLPGMDISSK